VSTTTGRVAASQVVAGLKPGAQIPHPLTLRTLSQTAGNGRPAARRSNFAVLAQHLAQLDIALALRPQPLQ